MTLTTALSDAKKMLSDLTSISLSQIVTDANKLISDLQSMTLVPPIITSIPVITSTPFNFAAVVCDSVQYYSSRYERYQNALVFTTTAINLRVQTTNVAAGGGTSLSFMSPKYGLLVNGVERATCSPPAGTRQAYFVGAFADEPDGLVHLQIVAYDTTGARVTNPVEGLLDHWAYLDRSGGGKNATQVALQSGSRDWETQATDGLPVEQQWALIDKATINTRRASPLEPRLGAPFSTAIPFSQITRINYVVPSDGLIRTPAVSKSGITVSENRQPYFFSDMVRPYPVLPIMDGPRGTATTYMVTDVKCGRAGRVYGADAWSRWVVDATGTRRTLFGMRHTYAPMWGEASLWGPEAECVGNWDSSIPVAERYPWESWGMCWDQRTLAVDETAPIPPGETEEPHFTGPTMFCTDRHGYVLKAVSSPISHAVPPAITRLASASDPWGMDGDGTTIYVAERTAHRISKFDMDSGAYLGPLIEDTTAATLGGIDPSLRKWIGANPATCRTHAIVSPEGVVVQDGYCYFGSLALGEVRRVPLAGGPYQVVCRPQLDNNSNYVYIAVSDGSFGPRGTIFVTSWTATNNGRPQAWLPIPGAAADGTPLTHSVQWTWQKFAQNIIQGPGGYWESGSYGTAVAVGRKGSGITGDPDYGMLVCSSADGDLSVYVQSTAADGPAPNQAQMRRGYLWYRQYAQLVHGSYCNGPNLPLPWGQNADADYWMKNCGYSQ